MGYIRWMRKSSTTSINNSDLFSPRRIWRHNFASSFCSYTYGMITSMNSIFVWYSCIMLVFLSYNFVRISLFNPPKNCIIHGYKFEGGARTWHMLLVKGAPPEESRNTIWQHNPLPTIFRLLDFAPIRFANTTMFPIVHLCQVYGLCLCLNH